MTGFSTSHQSLTLSGSQWGGRGKGQEAEKAQLRWHCHNLVPAPGGLGLSLPRKHFLGSGETPRFWGFSPAVSLLWSLTTLFPLDYGTPEHTWPLPAKVFCPVPLNGPQGTSAPLGSRSRHASDPTPALWWADPNPRLYILVPAAQAVWPWPTSCAHSLCQPQLLAFCVLGHGSDTSPVCPSHSRGHS